MFMIIFPYVNQTMAILNPLKHVDHEVMQDTDMAGPLVFCFAFGGCLLLVSHDVLCFEKKVKIFNLRLI